MWTKWASAEISLCSQSLKIVCFNCFYYSKTWKKALTNTVKKNIQASSRGIYFEIYVPPLGGGNDEKKSGKKNEKKGKKRGKKRGKRGKKREKREKGEKRGKKGGK